MLDGKDLDAVTKATAADLGGGAVKGKLADLIAKLIELGGRIDEEEARTIWAQVEKATALLAEGRWVLAGLATMQVVKLIEEAVKD